MSRKAQAPKREVLADPIYNSKQVTKLINQIMLDGKKGTAQANLSPVETLRLSISYDESTFQELSAILRPVFDGILANKIESLKLAEFRNLLLPKLMSGEIDVSKIGLMQLNSQFPKAWHPRASRRGS